MRPIAWVFLCAPALVFTACLDDVEAPAPVEEGARDASDASAPIESGASMDVAAPDGCAPKHEIVGGTCVPVLPAGARRLAIEVNPPDTSTYGTNLDLAKTVGVSTIPITLPWGYLLETSAPDAGTPVIATGVFSGISA